MVIQPDFQVHTHRSDKELLKVTIGGYNKTEIVNKLLDRLRVGDVAKTNTYAAELVCSGQTEILLNKVLAFASQENSVQNPHLPRILWRNYIKYYMLSTSEPAPSHRNNQELRNLVSEVVTISCLSPKSPLKFPKIGELDFELEYIKSRTVSTDTKMAEQVLRQGDPRDLTLPINELAVHILLKRQHNGDKFTFMTSEASKVSPEYWMAWFIEWDKNVTSKKFSDLEYKCAPRTSKAYDDKFSYDCVWVAWELFEKLAEGIGDRRLITTIKCLYDLYTFGFTRARKTERKFLFHQAIQYLTKDVDWHSDPFVDRRKVIRMSAQVNFLYQAVAKQSRAWEEQYRQANIARFVTSRTIDKRAEPVPRVNDITAIAREVVYTSQHANADPQPLTIEEEYRNRDYEQPSKVSQYELFKERQRLEQQQQSVVEEPQLEPLVVFTPPENTTPLPVFCSEGAGCVFVPKGQARRICEKVTVEPGGNTIKEVTIDLNMSQDDEH